MKPMLSAFFLMASSWLALGPAWAGPGDSYDDEMRIRVLDSEEVSCGRGAGLCLRAGDAMTKPSASGVAAGSWHPADEPVSFMRMPTRRGAEPDSSTPWVIDVGANLHRSALAGNTLFILYDTQDPQAVAKHQVTALWQAPVSGGNQIAARLTLLPDDGFHADHTYRLRLVQLIGSKEVVLSDGMIRLQ